MRVIICVCACMIASRVSCVHTCVCVYIFAYRPSVNVLSPSYAQINSWVASIVPRVSGPADYTNGHRCMQSVSLSFVCVSAQQSDEMSVSGEEIDEHTPETKRLATGNAWASDTKPAVLQLVGQFSKCVLIKNSSVVFVIKIRFVVFLFACNKWG